MCPLSSDPYGKQAKDSTSGRFSRQFIPSISTEANIRSHRIHFLCFPETWADPCHCVCQYATPPPAPERFAPAVLLSPPPRWSVALYSWPHFAPHFTRHPCANEGRGWLSWSRCVAPPGLRRPMGVRVLASFLPQQPKNQARLRRPGCHVYSACYGPSP